MSDPQFDPPTDRKWEFFETTRDATFKSMDALLNQAAITVGNCQKND